jgi:hypothetical protein
MVTKTNYICPLCSKYHLKDENINGDYDEDGFLLSFCPVCGKMYRIILSKNYRRTIAIRIAMQNNLDFNETICALKDAPEQSFVPYLMKTLNILKNDIVHAIEFMKEK